MSKAVLVMDMPEDCLECPCMRMVYEYRICQVKRKACGEDEHNRPDWCPLRELPEKQKADTDLLTMESGIVAGWNACLDEILAKGRRT